MTQENLEALKYLLHDRSFEGLRELIQEKSTKITKRLNRITEESIFDEITQETRMKAWELRGELKGLRGVLSMMNEEYVDTLLKARRENGNSNEIEEDT